jgi:hypothetical protein
MSRRRKVQKRVIRPEQINISREAEYIVRCAVEMRGRIVTLGPLLFFSTESGDAWVLDPADGLARCLARSGEPQALGIVETRDRFGVEWDAVYAIDGNAMIFRDEIGNERVVVGYPIREIEQAAGRMRVEG